jgi:hypothetical protein
MKSLIQLAICLVALLSMGGAWAQAPDAQTDENVAETTSATAAPVDQAERALHGIFH